MLRANEMPALWNEINVGALLASEEGRLQRDLIGIGNDGMRRRVAVVGATTLCLRLLPFAQPPSFVF
jgi:hypothetical protein